MRTDFSQEAFDIRTNPRADEGLVDLEYVVEEKPSDQIELSGGWGGGRVVGSLGLSFNNFSMRNFFKKDASADLIRLNCLKLCLLFIKTLTFNCSKCHLTMQTMPSKLQLELKHLAFHKEHLEYHSSHTHIDFDFQSTQFHALLLLSIMQF